MTLKEKQDKACEKFVKDWLNEELVSANFNNRELVFNTNDKEFPYLYITISAMPEEQGDDKIIELIEKQNYYDTMKRHRFIDRLMKKFGNE